MNAPVKSPVAETWARFVVDHSFEAMSEKAQDEVKRGIADCLGCIIAGIDTEVGRRISAFAQTEKGPSHVWGGSPATARNAALANGTMGHAHDLDDCIDSMRGHPSVPVVPAIFAVADEINASGRDVIAAYAAGVEIEGKIGKATVKTHPERGWHTTLTLGTLGATVAVANLLKLNMQQAQNALGLATSMASGLRVNFGTMTKPIHAGLAAQNGIFAVQLALAGIDSSANAFEGKQGFFDLFVGTENTNIRDAISNLGKPYEVLEPGLAFKLYPSCNISHPAIDIMLEGIASGEIDPKDVKDLTCQLGYRLHTNMIYDKAYTGIQGKFCLPYCIAAALLYGRVGFAEFEDKAVRNPEIDKFLEKINVSVHPDLTTIDTVDDDFTDIVINHHSGKRFHRRLMKPKGHPANPLSWDEHFEKFSVCTASSLGDAGTKKLWERLRHLDELPLSALYEK